MSVPRVAYPVCVAVATIGATAVVARTGDGIGLGSLLLGLVPLVVPTIWSISMLVGGEPHRQLLAAGAALLVIAALSPGGVALTMVSYMASGLLLGWGLQQRWRPDVVLGLALLPLAVIAIWALAHWPGEQALSDFGTELTKTMREGLPAGSDETARQALLTEYERFISMSMRILASIWPAMVLLGLMSHTCLVYLMARWIVRSLDKELHLRPLPPFHSWEVPFYLVWVLACGLVLIILRVGLLPRIGLNIVVVASFFFSVHGLAVQVNLLGRVLPPWLRILFWTAAAFFFAPLIMASSALLGLFDQWMNLRRFPGPAGAKPSS